MENNNAILIRIAKNAIVLALYVGLTFLSFPLSFSGLQFRVSEILIVLCFFNREYIIAITLGCFLTNLASPFMPYDLLIGTGATLVGCLILSFSKHLAIGLLFPIISNSFLVAIEYKIVLNEPYFLSVGLIAIGETTVIIVSYIFSMIFMKKEKMQKLINANRNLDFKF